MKDRLLIDSTFTFVFIYLQQVQDFVKFPFLEPRGHFLLLWGILSGGLLSGGDYVRRYYGQAAGDILSVSETLPRLGQQKYNMQPDSEILL